MSNQDSSTTIVTGRDTSTTTRLRGRWLWVARAGWVVVSAAATAVLIVGILKLYGTLASPCSQWLPTEQTKCQAAARSVSDAGLSPQAYATYLAAGVAFETLLWVALGLFIFARRSDEPLALLFSLALVLAGAVIDNAIPGWAIFAYPDASLLVNIITFLGRSIIVPMVYLLPDGRFIPRGTRWVAVLWVVRSFAEVFLPNQSINSYPYLPIVIVIFFATGVFSVVYRYRRAASPQQRQQIKWVAASLPVFIVVYSVGLFLIIPETGAGIWERIIYTAFRYAASFITGLFFMFSILRYRLWDVDFVINRSLVYGALTVLLGGIFVGGFFGVRALLGLVLGSGQDLIAIAIPAVAITALFNPARGALRALVDRRLYGIEIDYRRAAQGDKAAQAAPGSGETRRSFGSYSGLTLLARGGMGEVYRAQHPTLNREVAIKILPEHTVGKAEAEKRFLREAQTVAKLKHPNIVTLHDVGEQDGQPYMVMEYVQGQDLAELLDARGALPLAEALPILKDVAAALDYAHANGVIHRDIKPSNIIVEPITAGGGQESQRAVLMDFGIAKSYAATSRLTSTGMIGTLDYISPEQIQGAADVDQRADIYSLGVMAFQMLTGRLPFEHANPGAMVLAHLNQPPPDPREKAGDLPEAAALALTRAMAKKPDQRFSTAGEFVAALV